MKKEKEITTCFHSCPFFGISMDGMHCNHPFWDDKNPYENMIITQENSRNGNFPEQCPLKKGELMVVYKLKNYDEN